MKERLQKILSARGVASRRQAEEMIQSGRVVCNGMIAALGQTADPEVDEILVDGNPLPRPSNMVYLMLHKPRGYVTTLSDEKGRANAAQLVADCGCRVYPVGRLDMDSEGLLLFTNDGDFANSLMHPKHEVDKVYLARVTGNPSNEAIDRLRRGVYMEGDQRRTYPADVRVVRDESLFSDILVTIHEGRNRQVRRMCAKAGLSVLRLKRIREGNVSLDRTLKPGQWRELTREEITKLKNE